jgi:hypothetical protein
MDFRSGFRVVGQFGIGGLGFIYGFALFAHGYGFVRVLSVGLGGFCVVAFLLAARRRT